MVKQKDFAQTNQHEPFSLTQEIIEIELGKDLANRLNSQYILKEKGITIETRNRMETFAIYSFSGNNPHYSTMISSYLTVGSLKKLSELIADFSMDKLDSFEEDIDYSTMRFIQTLTDKQKNYYLFSLLSEKRKGTATQNSKN